MRTQSKKNTWETGNTSLHNELNLFKATCHNLSEPQPKIPQEPENGTLKYIFYVSLLDFYIKDER